MIRFIYGGRGSNRGIFGFFRLLYCLDNYIQSKLSQKYYKGTDDPLYLPCFNHDLKVCPKVKIPYYYGNFNYEAHKEIEEYNKNLPDWTKEN